MASFVDNTAAGDIVDGTIDIDTDTLKIILIGTATVYTPDRDNDFVDESGANDPIDAELTGVSGYTRGFGNSGRKTASIGVEVDKANDRAEVDVVDLTWTALGTGDTIAYAILIKEITNDAASPLITLWDVTDTPTNGSDVTLDFDAVEGAIRLTTV